MNVFLVFIINMGLCLTYFNKVMQTNFIQAVVHGKINGIASRDFALRHLESPQPWLVCKTLSLRYSTGGGAL